MPVPAHIADLIKGFVHRVSQSGILLQFVEHHHTQFHIPSNPKILNFLAKPLSCNSLNLCPVRWCSLNIFLL